MYHFVITFLITNILLTITSVVPQFPKVKKNALFRNSSANYLPLLKKMPVISISKDNKEILRFRRISIKDREHVNLCFTSRYIFEGHTVEIWKIFNFSLFFSFAWWIPMLKLCIKLQRECYWKFCKRSIFISRYLPRYLVSNLNWPLKVVSI